MCLTSPVTMPSLAAVVHVTPGDGFRSMKTGVSLSSRFGTGCSTYPDNFYAHTVAPYGSTVGYSSDGKAYGILVPGSDDMYVVQNGSGVVSGQDRTTINISWSINGTPTWTGGDDVKYYETTVNKKWDMGVGSTKYKFWPSGATSTGSVNSFLYVGPNTKPGTYQLAEYSTSIQCSAASAVLVDEGTTVDVGDFSCTVSAPPVVEFGDVQAAGKSDYVLLRSENMSLDVTCGFSQPLSATLTFSGRTDLGGGLSLWNDDQTLSAPAMVKGTMTGVTGAADNGCSQSNTTPGGIRFDNIESVSTIIVPGSIPLRFDLCKIASDRDGRVGVFTGTATVNVNWD